jgi:hypothetical protein
MVVMIAFRVLVYLLPAAKKRLVGKGAQEDRARKFSTLSRLGRAQAERHRVPIF